MLRWHEAKPSYELDLRVGTAAGRASEAHGTAGGDAAPGPGPGHSDRAPVMGLSDLPCLAWPCDPELNRRWKLPKAKTSAYRGAIWLLNLPLD